MYKATLDVIEIKFPGPVPDEERLRVMLVRALAFIRTRSWWLAAVEFRCCVCRCVANVSTYEPLERAVD